MVAYSAGSANRFSQSLNSSGTNAESGFFFHSSDEDLSPGPGLTEKLRRVGLDGIRQL
jgi:hypothetical protein